MDRRKFLKIAGFGAISLPFAGLIANSATKCKAEPEYLDWKQYEVSITRPYAGKEVEQVQKEWEDMVRRRMDRFREDLNRELFRRIYE
jgi:hypothetical protein